MFIGYHNKGTDKELFWEARLYMNEKDSEFIVKENTERKLLISVVEILSEGEEFGDKFPAIVKGSSYEECLKRLNSLYDGNVSRLREKISKYKQQITNLRCALHEKNLSLDALHYVWCSGGCNGGTHRWIPGKVTEELVMRAEANVKRLREWYANYQFKKKYGKRPPVTIAEGLDGLNKALEDMKEAADVWAIEQNGYPVMHNMGPDPCGKVAFYWVGDKITNQTKVDSKYIRMPDGSTPRKKSKIMCGNCGMHLSLITSDGVGRVR